MLKVDNLTFEVNEEGRKRCLVNHISFEVKDGEMLVITGPNGGGKSTLAKVLAGIEDANGGEIFLDEENITGYDIDHRANAGIGYAFQQPPRFKGMTVKKMLSLAAGKELTEAESCKLLSAVGLCSADYLNRQMDGTLSGGEMKRLEIATVLAKPHKVSIFDEPEAGIDLWSFSMLIRRFEEIHKEKRECLILISHQERIIQMADKIMVMYAGMVIEYATAREIFKDPKHPYTKGLLASIPRKDKDIDRLYTIEGTVPSLTSMPKGCRFCDRCTCAMEKCRNEQPPMYQFGERSVRCFLYEDKGGVSDER